MANIISFLDTNTTESSFHIKLSVLYDKYMHAKGPQNVGTEFMQEIA